MFLCTYVLVILEYQSILVQYVLVSARSRVQYGKYFLRVSYFANILQDNNRKIWETSKTLTHIVQD